VELRGGNNDDIRGFVYEAVDGSDVITVSGNNDIGMVTAKKAGIAKIGVSNPKAAYRMDIVVVVREKVNYQYIDIDKTFLILNKNEHDTITAEMIGNVPADWRDKFIFEKNNNSVEITQSGNSLLIKAVEPGKTIITASNEYADFRREVLIVVNENDRVTDNEVFIVTNQNVITMELGKDDAVLNMELVGGNEADRNNFVWTVDDSTIITVESSDGKVNYRDRSMVGDVNSKYETTAVITAKKVGTARITLENPKSKNDFTVIVKVYPKGTFGAVPVVLSGMPYYKAKNNDGIREITLGVVSGSKKDAEDLTWEIEDTSIATVEGTGVKGVITGKNSGFTTLKVSGAKLKYEFTAMVMVGSEDYLDEAPFIYVNNPYMSMIKNSTIFNGQTIRRSV
jgi:hypothetical protein